MDTCTKAHVWDNRKCPYCEVKRLREALSFYADKKTYQLGVSISMGSASPLHEPIKYDKGEKARKTLEGSE